MGTWGTGLFGNDMAADVRDELKMVVRAPWDAARIVEHLLNRYPWANDPKSEDYTDVRLAIADLFWQYGLNHVTTFRVAVEIIESGADLEVKRELGLSPADLGKRAKMLQDLRVKWKKPNGKPRPRRILKVPEPFVLVAGDCLVYPTSEGYPINPHLSESDGLYMWKSDGWTTALVLTTFRRFDVFARYLVAILDYSGKRKPDLQQFRRLNILHAAPVMDAPRQRVHGVHLTATHLRRMQVEIVGRLPLGGDRMARDFDVNRPPLSESENDFSSVAGFTLDALGNVDIKCPVAMYLKS